MAKISPISVLFALNNADVKLFDSTAFRKSDGVSRCLRYPCSDPIVLRPMVY